MRQTFTCPTPLPGKKRILVHPRVGGGVTFGAADVKFSFDADSARRLADMIHEVNGSTPKVDRLNMILLMCAVSSIGICVGIIAAHV